MSELFVHPLIVFPAFLNKSLIPSWSEARNFELPKVGLCHIAGYLQCMHVYYEVMDLVAMVINMHVTSALV